MIAPAPSFLSRLVALLIHTAGAGRVGLFLLLFSVLRVSLGFFFSSVVLRCFAKRVVYLSLLSPLTSQQTLFQQFVKCLTWSWWWWGESNLLWLNVWSSALTPSWPCVCVYWPRLSSQCWVLYRNAGDYKRNTSLHICAAPGWRAPIQKSRNDTLTALSCCPQVPLISQ